MVHLKPVLLFLFFLLTGFSHQSHKPHLTKWIIDKGCSLKVAGSTNVNKFNCVIETHSKPDTLTFYKGNSTYPILISGFLTLDVQKFDCHNPVMTADLRKTLKAKEYPKFIIRFISLNRYPDPEGKTEAVKGLVSIELAGVTKKFEIDYRFLKDKGNTLLLAGKRRITFSDFKIIPPRKIGGMIQTNNELDIEFNLRVRTL